MKTVFKLYLILIVLWPGGKDIYAEAGSSSYTISGYVKDNRNGEKLFGATVYAKEIKNGTSTNSYGYYALNLEPGTYTLEYSYVGYEKVVKTVQLKEDKTINVELRSSSKEIEGVTVEARPKDQNVAQTEMSTNKLESKKIQEIPALMGEVDVIKAIQMLPGVQTISEGSSGFNVRGGSMDQNLILLDEAPVYNASHLLGFFSVFNNDAINNVKLYKGYIPPRAGGRLSSLLDIRMKEGNRKSFSGSGGIGTISSRLTLEGPIQQNRASFMISGRRSYADLFLPLANQENIRNSQLYFYDMNAKLNYQIDSSNHIYLSGYFGRDVFNNEFGDIQFGNRTVTARWNHLYSSRLFCNLTFIRSQYDYRFGTPEGQNNSFIWTSDMKDYSLKADLTYYLNPRNTLKFGLHSTLHVFNPGMARGIGQETLIDTIELPIDHALENGIYISNKQEITQKLKLNYGLRYSFYANIGKATIYDYQKGTTPDDRIFYEAVDSTQYRENELYHTLGGLEPRFAINYRLNERSSLKASFSRTRQYIQLAKISTTGTPLDVWFSSNPNIPAQKANQYALGYFRNFFNHQLETSIEIYYKKIYDAIDFKDDAEILLNKQLAGELRYGQAESYGMELLVKKTRGDFTGWFSTTLSRVFRHIQAIQDQPFPAPYDKPISASLVLNYDISKRVSISSNWVYSSGRAATFPTGKAMVGGLAMPVYSDRNSYRYPEYHRLDVSITYKGKEDPDKFWHGEWNLSLYNVYNRHNAWAINFPQEENNSNQTFAEKTYLFPIIPSVTYNFEF